MDPRIWGQREESAVVTFDGKNQKKKNTEYTVNTRNNTQWRPATTRLVIRRIGCNAVDRASRFCLPPGGNMLK